MSKRVANQANRIKDANQFNIDHEEEISNATPTKATNKETYL